MNTIDTFKNILDERIAAWMELGIYESGDRIPRFMQKRLYGAYIKHPTTLSEDRVIFQLAVKYAREIKRPFMSAFEVKKIDVVKSTQDMVVLKPYRKIVRVKMQKRTAPLIAALALYGNNADMKNKWQAIETDAPAVWWPCNIGSTFRIDFLDNAHYLKFRDRCKYDPVFRKILEGKK